MTNSYQREKVDVSVVLPAYNEAGGICANTLETVTVLAQSGYHYEVIVVDDGSTDGTHHAALDAKQREPASVRVIRYNENRGKGHALLCGAAHARGEVVVFLDSDMDLRPEQLTEHLALLKRENLDVVVGSKLHPDSEVNYPKWRRVMSYGYYIFVRSLFGLPIRDTQTGIKSFRRVVLDKIAPHSRMEKFAFDVELLYLAHLFGFKMSDAPVKLEFRRGTFGRIRFKDVSTVFFDTIDIFVRLRLSNRKLAPMAIAPKPWVRPSYSEELHLEAAVICVDVPGIATSA